MQTDQQNLSIFLHKAEKVPYWEEDLMNRNSRVCDRLTTYISTFENPATITLTDLRRWFMTQGFPLMSEVGICAYRYSAPIKVELLLLQNREGFDQFYKEWLFIYRLPDSWSTIAELWQRVWKEEIHKEEVASLSEYLMGSRRAFIPTIVSYPPDILKLLNDSNHRLQSLKVEERDKWQLELRYTSPYAVFTNVSVIWSEQDTIKGNDQEVLLGVNDLIPKIQKKVNHHYLKQKPKPGINETEPFPLGSCHLNAITVHALVEEMISENELPHGIVNEICVGYSITELPGLMRQDDSMISIEHGAFQEYHVWNQIAGVLVDVTYFPEGKFSSNMRDTFNWGVAENHVWGKYDHDLMEYFTLFRSSDRQEALDIFERMPLQKNRKIED